MTPEGQSYTRTWCPDASMADATHLVWATGGAMVPADEMAGYVDRGRRQLAK